MKKGELYTFSQLLVGLKELEEYQFLRVHDGRNDVFALFTYFTANFSDAYQSGDGVLFYEDGEACSSDDDDLYLLMDFIKIKL